MRMKLFNSPPETRVFQAPGRVNLIGEHTDYNGGFVLPVNIDKNIRLNVTLRKDRMLSLSSMNFELKAECFLDGISYLARDGWANYPKGVAKVFQEQGFHLGGMGLLYHGDIPVSSGLSSSAAIEVVTAAAFCEIFKLKINKKYMALLCQRAENEFIGMKCGIMDQFVISLGKKEFAMYLDCRNLSYELIPLNLKADDIVIANTKVKRELVNSEYNKRRDECNEGVEMLKKHMPQIKQLRDVSMEDFNRYKDDLPDVIARRCKHVISENERVKKSVLALKEGNLPEFGKLMVESHNSLKEDYQVSCRELDIMVENALKIEGTVGSRMTGAGFGGCTVSIVKKEKREEFMSKVGENYLKETGIQPEFYVCGTADGAHEVK